METDESENDEAFDHDLDALRRACLISGADPSFLSPAAASAAGEDAGNGRSISDDDDDDDDDLELVRNIRNRFASSSEALDSLSFKPLCALPPEWSDDDADDANDDDFETLRAIQRRFAAYDNDELKHSPQNSFGEKELLLLDKKTLDDMCIGRVDSCEEHVSPSNAFRLGENSGEEQSCALVEWNHGNSAKPSQPNCSSFPKSAKVFMDAIKKNRSFQKLLRSKLIHIEAKIEENKKLKERVKILKDFELNCKKRTGRALSQKKDARVQLVSGRKAWPSKDLKVNDKKIPGMYCGPAENSHVENYRMALSKFPLSLDRKKWSETEKKNLAKGLHQQFQEMVLQNMVDRMSGSGESREGVSDIDEIMTSIKNLNITPENIRGFLPKVNWEQVASMFLTGRSGAECETRWLNFEDPLINRNPWTAQEDKNILFMVKSKGISNWFEIAISLGTNRTPFQCLSRYQRSLNVSILKREWTKEDDDKLRLAVEAFGECNWQAVASSLEGWTGTQCSNRWKKSLHPAREKVGRWTEDEDKRLTVAQMLFGPRNWKKTAQFVPGRTEVQCRERWVNSLDPSLNWEKWTQEEDSKLREAIAEHGYCWAKVAVAVPRRTDNMCRRRWKRLLPHEVPLLQAARRMQKAALICNFVDRESERPAIGPYDFCPLPLLTNDENVNESTKKTKQLRGGLNSCKKKRQAVKRSNVKRKKREKQSKESNQIDSDINGEIEAFELQETTANQVSEVNTQAQGPRIKTVMRSTNGEVLAGTDGGKLHPKRKQISKADEEVEHLQSHVTSNSDRNEPLVESNITKLPRKRRASSKTQNKGSPCTKKSTEHQSITPCSGELLLAGDHPTGSNHHHEGSSCVDTIQPMETNGKEIGELDRKARTKSEKNTGVKQCCKRKNGGEPTGVLLEAPVSVPSEVNELNNAKPSGISELDGKRKRGRPKKKQLVKADEGTQHLELQSVCVDSMSNSDRTEPCVESNTTNLSKKRRAYTKRQNNGSTSTKRVRKHESVTPSSGESLLEADPKEANHHREGSVFLETKPIAGEAIGTLDGKAGMASEKKKGRKQYPKRRKGSEPTGVLEEAHVPGLSVASELNMGKPSGISDPTKADAETERLESLTECVKSASNSNRTEPPDESNTSILPKKRRASLKQQNNRSACTKKRKQNHGITPFSGESLLFGDPEETNCHHEGSSCPVTLPPMGVTGEEVGTTGAKAGMTSEKNTGRKQYRKRKKGSESTGVLLEILVPVPSKANDLNELKPSCASDVDNSLTCPLTNQAKESKLQANNSANNLAKECIELPARQEKGLKCFDDSGISMELSFCTTGQSAVVDTNDVSGRPKSIAEPNAAYREVLKETVSVAVESSHEISDVSPSLSDLNKLEEALETYESNQQARTPSSLIRRSQLLSKRVNQLHHGNATLSITSDHDEPGGVDLPEPLVEVALEKPEMKLEEGDNQLDDLTCFLPGKSNKLIDSGNGMKLVIEENDKAG